MFSKQFPAFPLTPESMQPLTDAAVASLKGAAHETPVLESRSLSAWAGQQILLKCENMQRAGAFKFRGAWFATGLLHAEALHKGVVTHSSGNHAQALALAAKMRGIAAHVVMPEGAPRAKRAAVEGYGARVITCPPSLEARESTASAVVSETGGTLIPPYDHPFIIAGQSTVGAEISEQCPEAEVVVVPVGGGGLLSGVALALRSRLPEVAVVGAEPSGADDAYRSLMAGRLIPQLGPNTVADGLRTSLGEWTWPAIRDHVPHIFTATDEEIIAAMRWLWERAKLVVEPSGAIGVAVAASPAFRARFGENRRVVVVLSGGNVDLDALPW